MRHVRFLDWQIPGLLLLLMQTTGVDTQKAYTHIWRERRIKTRSIVYAYTPACNWLKSSHTPLLKRNKSISVSSVQNSHEHTYTKVVMRVAMHCFEAKCVLHNKSRVPTLIWLSVCIHNAHNDLLHGSLEPRRDWRRSFNFVVVLAANTLARGVMQLSLIGALYMRWSNLWNNIHEGDFDRRAIGHKARGGSFCWLCDGRICQEYSGAREHCACGLFW